MNRPPFLLWGTVLLLGASACTSTAVTVEISTIAPTLTLSASPTVQITTLLTSSPHKTQRPIARETTVSLDCWGEGGQIEQAQLSPAYLKEALIYRVYTPPCYEQQSDRRFPVLYLIHGQSYTDDQWDRLGADETANNLIGAGEVAPFIIVMPYDAHDRMLPPENAFAEELTKSLIPEIDQNYRTIANREHRAIGGLSRGGNWAIHIGFNNWEIFGSIGAHSTPTFVIDGINHLRDILTAIPISLLPRIYLDMGEHDRWGSTTLRLESMLTEENIPHEWHLNPGYHEEKYWRTHLEGYLRWYAADW